MEEAFIFQREEGTVNRDMLPQQQKMAFQDMYPVSKYTKYPDLINMEEWDKVKYDFKDKYKHYRSVVPKAANGTAVFRFEEEAKGANVQLYEPITDNPFIAKNFPRIIPSYNNAKTSVIAPRQEGIITHLYQLAKQKNPNIKLFEVSSIKELEKILIGEYMVYDSSSLIDTIQLKKDLHAERLFFNFYDDDNTPAAQASNFIYMNGFLLEAQVSEGDLILPYNKCEAIFMVLYYMRHKSACLVFLESMQVILGDYNGILQVEEMLSLLSSSPFKNEKLVSQTTAQHKLKGFPTLLDMKLCSYKLVVVATTSQQQEYFCDIRFKTFYIKSIKYFTFNECFEGMEDRFGNYRHSMLYTFKLLAPDEENFQLAKSIGLIDSRKIDWQFWKDNVIKHEFPSVNDFLEEKHYLLLLKMKKKYFKFFNNLITDYYRKSVYEPVSLVFNVMAITFALAGVMQVLQAANLIPPKP